jgi:hypothetical protein
MNRLRGGGGRQNPPQQPKSTQGALERVPCPHCGRGNDFRELDNQTLLDTGHKIICRGDKGDGCGLLMEVVAIRVIKVIAVKPIRGSAPTSTSGGPVRDATTIGQAQLQRLLKG